MMIIDDYLSRYGHTNILELSRTIDTLHMTSTKHHRLPNFIVTVNKIRGYIPRYLYDHGFDIDSLTLYEMYDEGSATLLESYLDNTPLLESLLILCKAVLLDLVRLAEYLELSYNIPLASLKWNIHSIIHNKDHNRFTMMIEPYN